MSDVTRRIHGAWCCDEHDRPHVHVGETDGQPFFLLGRTEFRGPSMNAVL